MPTAPPIPTATPFAAELKLAVDAARRAGAIQRDRYEHLERIVHKSERDVVTEVDHLCEELILAAIRERYPDDAILAEESGAHRSNKGAGIEPSAGAARVWVVDPLDGTVNYANGIPFFCVSIALVVDGRSVVGAVLDPMRDELFTAVAGGGAQLDAIPIRRPPKERLSDCIGTVAVPGRGYAGRSRAVRRALRVTRDLGSAALSLAYLGNGRLDLYAQLRGVSSWDVAAAGLIASEGGATVTDGDGGTWLDLTRAATRGSILASAREHHATILGMLTTG